MSKKAGLGCRKLLTAAYFSLSKAKRMSVYIIERNASLLAIVIGKPHHWQKHSSKPYHKFVKNRGAKTYNLVLIFYVEDETSSLYIIVFTELRGLTINKK